MYIDTKELVHPSFEIIKQMSPLDALVFKKIMEREDNLAKQKLISIPADGYYSDEKVYDSIIQTSFYKNQENQNCKTVDGFEFTYLKKTIDKTDLGKLFYKICVAEL